MILPKKFSVPMSFEACTITNTNSSIPHEEQQLLQFAQNSEQQILLNPVEISVNAGNSQANNTMLNANPIANIKNHESKLLEECVMPDIHLTKDFTSCKKEQLRSHGFTHIIIIDKHIQELYYPNQQPDIFKLCSMSKDKTKSLKHDYVHDNSSSLNAFDYYCPPSTATNPLSFGKEFEVIDLNFVEKSYLTTVLPNCYRAVKFINKALQACGKILVIDCNGGEQKCVTIIVAYLMYKHNISFSNAFARLKQFYNKADLDRFYISQLYEYEPILQVQRAQSRGHSCSRELHAAILKRKKPLDDEDVTLDTTPMSSYVYANASSHSNAITTTELINNCNPLNRFDSTQMERQEIKTSNHHNHSMTLQDNRTTHALSRFMSVTTSSTRTTRTDWDDCAME